MIDNNRIPHALLLEGPAGIGKFAGLHVLPHNTYTAKTASTVTVAESVPLACNINHSTTSTLTSYFLS